jgi:hypothetical protein
MSEPTKTPDELQDQTETLEPAVANDEGREDEDDDRDEESVQDEMK